MKVLLSASVRKSIRLQVTSQGEVDIRVPVGTPKADVLTFVRRHQDWLSERRDAVKERERKRDSSLMLYGRELPIVDSALGEFLVTDQQVWMPHDWPAEKKEKAIDKWQREEARRCFTRLIEEWWPRFSKPGRERPVLRVKRMRTRWGSLSKRGYINLNLALLSLPEDLIELVVVHELCHLEHFDHGPGFKAAMTSCLPDWRARDKRINQAGLMLL
ncbi:SprT family zinc-dependent metalloprotease [Thalassolituus maritimus]|uniref:SprT family zinc-dependent metalloprotease n=1 Tax=Thalassolituus maritimus TaxID=484498 RepID=A0ABP9ZZK4_9GAMM